MIASRRRDHYSSDREQARCRAQALAHQHYSLISHQPQRSTPHEPQPFRCPLVCCFPFAACFPQPIIRCKAPSSDGCSFQPSALSCSLTLSLVTNSCASPAGGPSPHPSAPPSGVFSPSPSPGSCARSTCSSVHFCILVRCPMRLLAGKKIPGDRRSIAHNARAMASQDHPVLASRADLIACPFSTFVVLGRSPRRRHPGKGWVSFCHNSARLSRLRTRKFSVTCSYHCPSGA